MSNNAVEAVDEPGVEWFVCTAEHSWEEEDSSNWMPREAPDDGPPKTIRPPKTTRRFAHPDAVLVNRATRTGFYKCPHCKAGFIDDLPLSAEGDEFTGQLFDLKGEF